MRWDFIGTIQFELCHLHHRQQSIVKCNFASHIFFKQIIEEVAIRLIRNYSIEFTLFNQHLAGRLMWNIITKWLGIDWGRDERNTKWIERKQWYPMISKSIDFISFNFIDALLSYSSHIHSLWFTHVSWVCILTFIVYECVSGGGLSYQWPYTLSARVRKRVQ